MQRQRCLSSLSTTTLQLRPNFGSALLLTPHPSLIAQKRSAQSSSSSISKPPAAASTAGLKKGKPISGWGLKARRPSAAGKKDASDSSSSSPPMFVLTEEMAKENHPSNRRGRRGENSSSSGGASSSSSQQQQHHQQSEQQLLDQWRRDALNITSHLQIQQQHGTSVDRDGGSSGGSGNGNLHLLHDGKERSRLEQFLTEAFDPALGTFHGRYKMPPEEHALGLVRLTVKRLERLRGYGNCDIVSLKRFLFPEAVTLLEDRDNAKKSVDELIQAYTGTVFAERLGNSVSAPRSMEIASYVKERTLPQQNRKPHMPDPQRICLTKGELILRDALSITCDEEQRDRPKDHVTLAQFNTQIVPQPGATQAEKRWDMKKRNNYFKARYDFIGRAYPVVNSATFAMHVNRLTKMSSSRWTDTERPLYVDIAIDVLRKRGLWKREQYAEHVPRMVAALVEEIEGHDEVKTLAFDPLFWGMKFS